MAPVRFSAFDMRAQAVQNTLVHIDNVKHDIIDICMETQEHSKAIARRLLRSLMFSEHSRLANLWLQHPQTCRPDNVNDMQSGVRGLTHCLNELLSVIVSATLSATHCLTAQPALLSRAGITLSHCQCNADKHTHTHTHCHTHTHTHTLSHDSHGTWKRCLTTR